MESKLAEALSKLDPKNDAHWTKEGLPFLVSLSEFMGEDVTRRQLNDIYPDFTRKTPTVTEADTSPVDAIGAAQAELDSATIALVKAQLKVKALELRHSAIVELETRSEPAAHIKNQNNISAYLKGQKQDAAAKAARRAEVLRAGVTPEDLQAGMPVDRVGTERKKAQRQAQRQRG